MIALDAQKPAYRLLGAKAVSFATLLSLLLSILIVVSPALNKL